jgi:hypothetical protein
MNQQKSSTKVTGDPAEFECDTRNKKRENILGKSHHITESPNRFKIDNNSKAK